MTSQTGPLIVFRGESQTGGRPPSPIPLDEKEPQNRLLDWMGRDHDDQTLWRHLAVTVRAISFLAALIASASLLLGDAAMC